MSNYAFDLSRDYEEQAADAALGRDIVVSLIFASAGASVLGSIQGLADEAIAKRALAGVAASEIGKYASPATASAAIYKAAKQMNCIGVQTTSFSALDSDPGASLQARAAAFGAIRESQIRLKEGLKRTAPDFSTLRNALATGAAASVLVPGVAASNTTSDTELIENNVMVTTPDGQSDCYFVHPKEGRHPGVILWPA